MPTETAAGTVPRASGRDDGGPARRGRMRRGVVLLALLIAAPGAVVGLASLRSEPEVTLLPEPQVTLLPEPQVTLFPEPDVTLLTEDFQGEDAVWADERRFWHPERTGQQDEDPESGWFAEAGVLERRDSQGWTDSPVMRVWTRRDDLAFTQVDMDVTFKGWVDGSAGWHGINLWLNESLCTPTPGCERIDDGQQGGPSGYALDFMNRDGTVTILKKVAGDTREAWPGAVSHSNGGTYYKLAETTFEPAEDRTYHFAGRVVDSGDGTATLQVIVDGEVLLQAVDDGTVTGPRLTGGRVGLRSDYVELTVDDVVIRR